MENHIKKWLEKGYINNEQSDILLNDIKNEKKKNQQTTANVTFYTIGSVLLGISIISFISSNDWILDLFNSHWSKIIASILATILCLGFGCYLVLKKENLSRFGDVLIFLSTILIGGTYILISKVYNIDIDTSPGSAIYLLWSISILPFAFIFKKQSINILSLVLFIFYTLFSDLYNIFEMLIPIVFGVFIYCLSNIPVVKNKYPEFSKVYKITAIFPLFFAILYISTTQVSLYGNSINCSIVFLCLFVATILNFVFNKEKNNLLKIETLILCLICCFAIRLNLTHTIIPEIVWTDILIANLIIIITIACLYNYAYKLHNKDLAENANFFLFAYIVALYYRLGYSYLDRALFFFLGGIGLLIAGIFIEKRKKYFLENAQKSDEGETNPDILSS